MSAPTSPPQVPAVTPRSRAPSARRRVAFASVSAPVVDPERRALVFGVTTTRLPDAARTAQALVLAEYSRVPLPRSVRRPFAAFEWLVYALGTAHPGVVVPSLPDSPNPAHYGDAFHCEKKRRRLERFLERVCAHAVLSTHPALYQFLLAEDLPPAVLHWAAPSAHARYAHLRALLLTGSAGAGVDTASSLTTFREMPGEGGVGGGVTTTATATAPSAKARIGGFLRALSERVQGAPTASHVRNVDGIDVLVQPTADDELFAVAGERTRACADRSWRLVAALTEYEAAARACAEAGGAFGRELLRVGQGETDRNSGAGFALCRLGRAAIAAENLSKERALADVLVLGDPVVESARDAEATKTALNVRTAIVAVLRDAVAQARAKDGAHTQQKRSLDYDPTKTARAKKQLDAAEAEVAVFQQRLAACDGVLQRELEGCVQARVASLSRAFADYARAQAALAREQSDAWTAVLGDLSA